MRESAPGSINRLDRILVVKLADLGDAILATSAIGALRSSFPSARIDVLTAGTGALAFDLCPAIDHIITIDKRAFDNPSGLANPRNAASLISTTAHLRRAHYDAVVLLHHLTTSFGALKFRWLCRAIGAPVRAGLDNGRGDFLTHRAIDYGFGAKSVHDYGLDVARLLGATVESAAPPVLIPEDARSAAHRLLQEHDCNTGYVVIHPSVGDYSPARNWYPERFGAVAAEIAQSFELSVVVVGASDASAAAQRIGKLTPVVDLSGKTSFAELAAVLEGARLVLGADSGVVHLSAALATPTVAIFGPSNARAWQPFGATLLNPSDDLPPTGSVFALCSDLPCSPCFYSGFALGRRDGCALRSCLDVISARNVTQIATTILAREDTPKSTMN